MLGLWNQVPSNGRLIAESFEGIPHPHQARTSPQAEAITASAYNALVGHYGLELPALTGENRR